MRMSGAGDGENESAPAEAYRRVFFSPPGQPNEISVSPSHVQWAQQLVEARWVPAYDPELAHSAGQDSRCFPHDIREVRRSCRRR